MKLLRLCATQIRLNEPLPWNVRNEPGALLLSKGFLIKEQHQIDTLLDRGVYVDQEEFEAQQRAAKAAQPNPRPTPSPFGLPSSSKWAACCAATTTTRTLSKTSLACRVTSTVR